MCERRAEESVMLGVRWCLMVQRPGLSNCDWVHPPPSEGQGKSEKLKSHNQFFVRERASTVRTRAARGLYVMRPSATSGPADMTQVISPQHHSAHAHSQDGNRALYAAASLCSWLAALDDLFFVFFLHSVPVTFSPYLSISVFSSMKRAVSVSNIGENQFYLHTKSPCGYR